jgi:hypothetical protein
MPCGQTPGSSFPARSPIRLPAPLLLAIAGSLLAFPPPPAEAQSRVRGPLVLELPASTRALALGNSFTLASPGPEGLFYHPGVVDRVQGLTASVQRYGPSATLAAVSAGQSWLSGGVALGVQVLTYGAATSDPVTGEDVLALPADVASLREGGEAGVSEIVVAAAYGRSVKGIRLGGVGKLVEQRFGPIHGATGALDLGAALSSGPVTLGLAARNLGPALAIGGEDVPLPVAFTLGGSSRQAAMGPLDISAAGAVTYRLDGDVVPSAGLEVAYWPVTGRTFVGRIGFRRVPESQSGSSVTFGGAFLGDSLILEYAYEGFESGSASHRLGIGWR